MIAMLCADDGVARQLRLQLAQLGHDVELAESWAELDEVVRRAICGVVYLPHRISAEAVEWLRVRLQGREVNASSVPLVLVPADVADLVSILRGPIAHTVLSQERAGTALLGAVTCEVSRAALLELRRVLTTVRMHPVLLGSLLPLFSMQLAIPCNVREMGRLQGVGSGTLHKYWKSDGLGRLTGFTLRQFVDRVWLLRLRTHKGDGRSWERSADDVGKDIVHARRVGRLRIGKWPGSRHPRAWLEFALGMRAIAAALR